MTAMDQFLLRLFWLTFFCITCYYMSGDLVERGGPAPPSNPLHRRVEDLVSIDPRADISSRPGFWSGLVEP